MQELTRLVILFQAEDVIRDGRVTGVQTCALPISPRALAPAAVEVARERGLEVAMIGLAKQFEEIYLPGRPDPVRLPRNSPALFLLQRIRDEIGRASVGKECKCRWWP